MQQPGRVRRRFDRQGRKINDDEPAGDRHSRHIWFPAKSYGWGWGLPVAWQGWLVLLAYFVLLGTGILLIAAEEQMVVYFTYVGLLTAALIAICWHKGEKPKWRWGRKGKD